MIRDYVTLVGKTSSIRISLIDDQEVFYLNAWKQIQSYQQEQEKQWNHKNLVVKKDVGGGEQV